MYSPMTVRWRVATIGSSSPCRGHRDDGQLGASPDVIGLALEVALGDEQRE
jgi:hypothetical protein